MICSFDKAVKEDQRILQWPHYIVCDVCMAKVLLTYIEYPKHGNYDA